MSSDSQFPEEIRLQFGTRTVCYRLDPDCRAHSDSQVPGEVPGYSVRHEPVSEPADHPVYRADPGGTPLIPTGRIHLRVKAPEELQKLRPALDDAGFEIETIPTYAPHTAWLRPVRGGISHSLEHWQDLEELAGVERVEPQLLRPVERREPPADA